MGEAKRRRELGIVRVPKYTKQDWSRLDIPDCRVYLSAWIDGVPRFTLGWDATTLAQMFPKFDATESLPRTMDQTELSNGQEALRQGMIAATSQEELGVQALIMAWLALVRVPEKDYREMTQGLRDRTKEYYIHAICRSNHWVFTGGPEEASESNIAAVLHAAYPEKFPDIQ